MTYVTGIPSKDVPKTWPLVRKFIESGLGEDGADPEKIYARLLRTECQLFVAKDNEAIVAACVTELGTTDSINICSILCIGGSGMNDWLIYLPQIERWANAKERKKITIAYPRPAWARILKDNGYRLNGDILEKVL